MQRSVVLIGPMGVGKTTIGKKLAKRLNLPFYDTDNEIVRQHGPIPKIFETVGEEVFRKFETEALISCLDKGGVIATGGGVITQAANLVALQGSLVVYLSTDGRHMAARLITGKRPLLKRGIADWRRIYEERKPLYESACTFEVSTSGKPLGKIIEEVVEQVNL